MDDMEARIKELEQELKIKELEQKLEQSISKDRLDDQNVSIFDQENPTMAECPICSNQMASSASKCPHCGHGRNLDSSDLLMDAWGLINFLLIAGCILFAIWIWIMMDEV